MALKLPSRRTVTAAAPQAAVVIDLEAHDPGRAQRVRAIAAAAGKVAGVVTVVPFMPPQVRFGAGAITGVSTALDVAFRPRGERAVAAAANTQSDRQIFSDPAAMAADVTSALTAGALAAGQAIVGVRGSRLFGRTVRIVIATGIVAAGAAIGYRFVIRPALDRRERRRSEAARARALIVFEERAVEVAPGAPFDATPETSAPTETAASTLLVELEGATVPAVDAAAGLAPTGAEAGTPDTGTSA
jgi:hypothetical protein